MCLGMPITHELPPKWMENEEVLCCLRGEVKTSSSNKPRMPSQINYLVTTFSNTINSFLSQESTHKLCSRITPEDDLIAMFQWSCIVNQHLQNSAQQYEDLITEFEDQKQNYYCDVYQQGYYNGKNSKKP